MHYPLDVIGGWIAGLLSALLIYYFYKNYFVPEEKFKTGS
jgi:membrane-associated phospholipid phosphatase